MDRQIVALCIQEAGRFVTGLMSLRTPKPKGKEEYQPTIMPPAEWPEIQQEIGTEEKIEKGTACLPCTNSHLHACTGFLDEAVRMSHDGLNPDSMKRVDKCLGEIVAAERIDLAPENIQSLSEEEKEIAHYATRELREIRHGLEGLSSPEQIEDLAARTTKLQQHVSKEWFKLRISKMNPEQRQELKERVKAELRKDLSN